MKRNVLKTCFAKFFEHVACRFNTIRKQRGSQPFLFDVANDCDQLLALAQRWVTAGNLPSGVYQKRTLLGRAPLLADGSTRINVPGGAGTVFALEDASGMTVVTMTEEHQLAPGEQISLGIRASLFNAVCGGCHGSVSGSELDVAVNPDALTGASASLSRTAEPFRIGP